MGSVLRLVTDTADVGYLPRPFDQALEEGRFRRSLPKDGLAFVRSVASAERRDGPFTEGPTVLDTLRRLEAFEREDRARRSAEGGVPLAASDLAFLRTARRARIHEARLRTAFDEPGRAWNDRLAGPITGKDAWRDITEGESRAWVSSVLGPVQMRADGAIVRPGHACHDGPRPFASRFESREQPIEIRFVPPHEHPDWRALSSFVEANPDLRYRVRAG